VRLRIAAASRRDLPARRAGGLPAHTTRLLSPRIGNDRSPHSRSSFLNLFPAFRWGGACFGGPHSFFRLKERSLPSRTETGPIGGVIAGLETVPLRGRTDLLGQIRHETTGLRWQPVNGGGSGDVKSAIPWISPRQIRRLFWQNDCAQV